MGFLFPCHDWQNSEIYMPLAALDRPGIAWEFLRRDPTYQGHLGASELIEELDNGAAVIPAELGPAEPWGLSFSESEYLPAGIARIFWRADYDPHVLLMGAEPACAAADDSIDFCRMPGELFVQPRRDQGEHVLIRFGGMHLRIDVVVGSVLEGPIHPRAVLPGLVGISPQLRTLRRLGALTQRSELPASLRSNERRAWRWAKMIQALDGVVAGGSHRDIAMAIYGADVVRAEWRGASDHLRLKVQRLVREAKRLAGGGYRAILKGEDD